MVHRKDKLNDGEGQEDTNYRRHRGKIRSWISMMKDEKAQLYDVLDDENDVPEEQLKEAHQIQKKLKKYKKQFDLCWLNYEKARAYGESIGLCDPESKYNHLVQEIQANIPDESELESLFTRIQALEREIDYDNQQSSDDDDIESVDEVDDVLIDVMSDKNSPQVNQSNIIEIVTNNRRQQCGIDDVKPQVKQSQTNATPDQIPQSNDNNQNMTQMVECIKQLVNQITNKDSRDQTYSSVRRPAPMLPALNFDGDFTKYRSFINSFDSLYGKLNIPNTEKFDILMTTLKGEAKAVVDGFNSTDRNYIIVRDILEEKFGKQKLILNKLHMELRRLKRTKDSDDQEIFRSFERIIRQLQGIGEDVDQPIYEHILKSLLPPDLLNKVIERSDDDPYYNVTDMRRMVDKYYQRRKTVAEFNHEVQDVTLKDNSKREIFHNRLLNSNKKNNNSTCLICNKSNHSTADCRQISSLSIKEIKDRLTKKKICCYCIRDYHGYCEAKCAKCNGKHHLIWCDKKDRPMVNRVNTVDMLEHEGPKLLTTRVLLSWNGNKINVNALIDPGSELNLISPWVTKELHADQTEDERKMNIKTLTTEKTISISSRRYMFNVICADGSNVKLQARTLPKINGKYLIQDVKNDKVINKNYESVDLVIGMESFFDIVNNVRTNDDGYHMLDTKLGPVCGGKAKIVKTMKFNKIDIKPKKDYDNNYGSSDEDEANAIDNTPRINGGINQYNLTGNISADSGAEDAEEPQIIKEVNETSIFNDVRRGADKAEEPQMKHEVNNTSINYDDNGGANKAEEPQKNQQINDSIYYDDRGADKAEEPHIIQEVYNTSIFNNNINGNTKPINDKLFINNIIQEEYSKNNNNENINNTDKVDIIENNAKIDPVMENVQQISDKQLAKQVEQLWRLETIGILDKPNKKIDEETEAVQLYQDNLQYIKDGDVERYETRLLWKINNPDLTSTYYQCRARLKQLYRDLCRRKLLERYHECIMDLVKLEFLEPVTQEKTYGVVNYLPHRPVIRENKTHTKIRQVLDASMKSKEGLSINDCLHQGPNLLKEISAVLMKSRLHKKFVIADIAKAFLQIAINEQDRDALRILWLKDISKPPINSNIAIYRFKRLPFGLNLGPFILNMTVAEHLKRTNTPISKEILENIYADNVSMGGETTEEIVIKCEKAIEIFRKAGMLLREFFSNDQTVQQAFSDEPDKTVVKMLGVLWDANEDTYTIQWPTWTPEKEIITKRDILSHVSKVYDPNGWSSPAHVKEKLFQQEMHEPTKKALMKPLSNDEVKRWMQIVQTNAGKTFKIPRYVDIDEEAFEIHGFSDASNVAMCAAVYIKSLTTRKTYLMLASSRLGPSKSQKQLTIPQLELVAAEITCAKIKYVINQMENQPKKIVLWTDSKIVKHWLTGDIDDKPIFVKNRVKKIRELNADIKYVNTKDNPADLGTRGISLEELQQSKLWFKGPSWLSSDETEWPKQDITVNLIQFENDNDSENNKETIMNGSNYNKWSKMVRVRAYIHRFINICAFKSNISTRLSSNFKHVRKEGPIATDEYILAEKKLIQDIQTQYPPSKQERKKLYLRQEDNVWIKQHRLNNMGWKLIWLPRQARETLLIIQNEHEKCMHGSEKKVWNQIRTKFWITRPSSIINKACKLCARCVKLRAKPFELPIMPQLPAERLDAKFPFETSGVDYFGPVYMKQNNKTITRYIALFTCAVTRAVHLEIAQDLSGKACLNVLRRFISRRGKPNFLYSDHGTNFVVLRKVAENTKEYASNDDELVNFCCKSYIKWKMTTPMAPWQGGWWERLVGITKNVIIAAIGKNILQEDDFFSILCEIEVMVNSRPICELGNDDELAALRPQDFLTPLAEAESPIFDSDKANDPDFEKQSTEATLRNTWIQQTMKLQKAWKRFVDEYLPSLLNRQIYHKHNKNAIKREPVVGEMVLIKDENVKRLQWKTGIVKELERSKDGKTRSAKILTANQRVLSRPINFLYSLETIVPEIDETTIGPPRAPFMDLKNPNVIDDNEGEMTSPVQGIKSKLCRGRPRKDQVQTAGGGNCERRSVNTSWYRW